MNSTWKQKNGEIGRTVHEAILEISKCMAPEAPVTPERIPAPWIFSASYYCEPNNFLTILTQRSVVSKNSQESKSKNIKGTGIEINNI